ncbi:FkbM family methyltransferase [Flavobacterium saliperosum]|uniref:Methyltransferase, FkbM family n=1 Tax=Flavobacterium saliperosum TaxID=329186 RepID=A0A1G4VMN1_9FLAO|nr:FkbM family methyltransferase [Flavobacterium saliperosum]SCX09102.1 methyltransferase, FkbM family [Flavobacterium saliperosum]
MIQALIQLAYKFWPELYKKRFFKKLNSLHTDDFKCEPELLYLHQVLKNDSVFIDIGTNKGIYLYQAEKVIKTGKIIGFEPNKKLVEFCAHLFKTAKVYPFAASSSSGISVLNIPKKGNGLQDTRASLEALGDDVEKIEIETIRLDDWVAKQGLAKIDLIKIDVEGHEFDSIKGCENILKTIKPIFIIEIELRHAHYPIKDIFDFIIGFGYEVFYFDRKNLKIAPFDFNQIANFQKDEYLNDFNRYINNFIFIPKPV